MNKEADANRSNISNKKRVENFQMIYAQNDINNKKRIEKFNTI